VKIFLGIKNWYAVFPMREEVILSMKKLFAVAAVTILASSAALAGTLSYGFINDNGGAVSGDPITPPNGEATFVRTANFSSTTIDLTAIMVNTSGATVGTNTATLDPGEFLSWRPRFFQGITPNGTGATGNGSLTVYHTGLPGDLGGNIVVISSNGSRLGFLVQEQN
jgi:hypothetical protein